MAGGGGVEDAPLINDPTLITHNRSDWNHSETLMWSELRAGLQMVKIHQKLEPLILNQINVTSLTLFESSSAAEGSLTVYQSFVQHVHTSDF